MNVSFAKYIKRMRLQDIKLLPLHVIDRTSVNGSLRKKVQALQTRSVDFAKLRSRYSRY